MAGLRSMQLALLRRSPVEREPRAMRLVPLPPGKQLVGNPGSRAQPIVMPPSWGWEKDPGVRGRLMRLVPVTLVAALVLLAARLTKARS